MIRLHNYDCLNVLKMMIEDEVFVDSIVTDPPYELGFMGRSWDSTGIAFQKETWELCFEVLKPGGHLLAFSGSRTYHRMAVAIEDAGFSIRDQIMWLYGSGFPKSMNIGKTLDKKLGNERESLGTKIIKSGDMRSGNYNKGGDYDDIELEITKGNSEWEGWGTALKPAHEPLVLARKPLSEKSVVDNVLKHRTGGINIDECRVEGNDAKYPDTNPDFRDQGRQSKENMGIDKLSFGQTENVKRKRANRNPRTDESVFNKSTTGFKSETQEFADADPRGRFPANIMHDGLDESWAKYFYCPKTSKSERHNSAIKNTHPTVKPVELMKYLCRLVTPKGGTVLDPFMGSGSTGMAAKDEGFDFIGIEKEKEYYEIAEARIKKTAPLMDFFS